MLPIMMIYFRNAQLKMNINLKNLDKIKILEFVYSRILFLYSEHIINKYKNNKYGFR
jgi:hypothetical protein